MQVKSGENVDLLYQIYVSVCLCMYLSLPPSVYFYSLCLFVSVDRLSRSIDLCEA